MYGTGVRYSVCLGFYHYFYFAYAYCTTRVVFRTVPLVLARWWRGRHVSSSTRVGGNTGVVRGTRELRILSFFLGGAETT